MVFTPLTFISLLICAGAIFRSLRIGRLCLRGGIVLLAIAGFSPLGHNSLVWLETRHPRMTEFPDKVDGIIVLGGAIELRNSVAHQQIQLNDRAARLTEMVFLGNLYPDAKLVFTGGDGELNRTSTNESIELNTLLKNIGFNPSRVIFEGESRNTYENMEFSKTLVKPGSGEKWVLVTSAFHMPRSAAIFESNGWAVTPYPAGYLTDGQYRVYPSLDVLGNMYKFQVAAREFIGIMAYTLTDKIKAQ